jgi:hypothetical protein
MVRAALLICTVLAAVSRVTIASEGGAAGIASVALFAVFLIGYVVLSFKQDILGTDPGDIGPRIRWTLIAACVASLIAFGLVENEPFESILLLLFFLTLIAAGGTSLGLWIAKVSGE